MWSLGLRRVRQVLPDQQASSAAVRCATSGGAAWSRPCSSGSTVPAPICGSFSDNDLHSRGSFRGLQSISSTDRVPVHPPRRQGGQRSTSRRGARRAAPVLRPLPAGAGCPGAATGPARGPREPRRDRERARRGRLAAGTHPVAPAVPDRCRPGRRRPPSAAGQITFGTRGEGACFPVAGRGRHRAEQYDESKQEGSAPKLLSSVSAATGHWKQAPSPRVPKVICPGRRRRLRRPGPAPVRYSGGHWVRSSGQLSSSRTLAMTSRLSRTSSLIRGGAGTSCPRR